MKGLILYEALFLLSVYAVLVGGAQLATTKFWIRRLELLQQTRLNYDGVPLWTEPTSLAY